MNEPLDDRGPARALGLILAASFLVATLLVLLVQFNITAAAPEFRPGENVLVDNILIRFESEQAAWPQDLAASLLFAVGFASVAGLGATLPRLLGADGARTGLAAGALVLAGTVGMVGELLDIGIKEVAISTTYCECALRDAQLIARAEALELVTNAVGWFTDGFAVIFGIGLLVAARLAGGSATMTDGWRNYTMWLGVAGVAFVIIGRILSVLSSPEFDVGMIGLVLVALVAGILTPIWGFWTARSLRTA